MPTSRRSYGIAAVYPGGLPRAPVLESVIAAAVAQAARLDGTALVATGRVCRAPVETVTVWAATSLDLGERIGHASQDRGQPFEAGLHSLGVDRVVACRRLLQACALWGLRHAQLPLCP